MIETMHCQRCGKEWKDFDGFGVLYCLPSAGGCGYCKHASVMNGICLFCERQVERTSTVNGESDG